MTLASWLRRLVPLAAFLAVVAACGQDPVEPLPVDARAPDFSLPDVNANSATMGEFISPRTYLGSVSAWYFGHST